MDKIGEVTHYFTGIEVSVIELKGKLKEGDTIALKGSSTDFEQKVDSMEIDRAKVKEAGPGQSIGMKMAKRVRPGDEVFKV
ncbi:MAG: translation elongation factor-like protein [Candidatus Altiarchaeota archaeon]|nr:translation elongation factor-like protein [Candidatus Altiarchaeota archaeon]